MPRFGDQAADAVLAHQPLDALAADPFAVGHDELGVDARRSVDAPVERVDLADALEQPHPRAGGPTAPGAAMRESPTATLRARGTSS
jgi:hypothetical protein